MDNHIFRSAALGFNRQDVMEYIERTQREAEAAAAALEANVDSLRQEAGEARLALETCVQEKEELSRLLEDTTQRWNNAKSNWETQAQAKEALRRDLNQRDQTIKEMTAENQRLFHQVEALESQMDGFRREKERIAQLELDAHQRAEEILAHAEEQARSLLEHANAQAESTVADANAQAESTVADANAQAESTIANANAQAESTVTEAADRAETTLREAEDQAQRTKREALARAESLTTQANAQAETTISQAESRAASLLADAQARISETVSDYDQLLRSLDAISGHINGELRKLDAAAAQLPRGFQQLRADLSDFLAQAQEPQQTLT